MKNKFLQTGESGYHPLRKVRVVFSGIRFGVLLDIGVSYKLLLSAFILVLSIYFHDWIDLMVILIATAQVLAAELFNTAIEALCDFVETARNEKIRVIKDISAAAAGISIVAWAIVIVYEYYKLVIRLMG